jgi:hypothetical protein
MRRLRASVRLVSLRLPASAVVIEFVLTDAQDGTSEDEEPTGTVHLVAGEGELCLRRHGTEGMDLDSPPESTDVERVAGRTEAESQAGAKHVLFVPSAPVPWSSGYQPQSVLTLILPAKKPVIANKAYKTALAVSLSWVSCVPLYTPISGIQSDADADASTDSTHPAPRPPMALNMPTEQKQTKPTMQT